MAHKNKQTKAVGESDKLNDKNKKQKRRLGDRRDGKLIRDIDSMHYIMPIIYPNRCDNEAYIAERIDLTNLNEYIAKLNATEQELPYTMFHLIVTALLKTIALRPKMNRFIANRNMYQRNEVSASFVVKKQFTDGAGEGLAFVHAKDDDTLETIHETIRKQVILCRSEKPDKSTEFMDIFTQKMPRWFSKFVIEIVRKLERKGKCPKSFIETDPYYASAILSNVGSIKLKSGYHHLTNWGTTSIFCLIGERRKTPHFDQETGKYVMRETVDVGFTIDERLADGYYYSKTIRLFKHLLQNPQLLELPLNEEIEY